MTFEINVAGLCNSGFADRGNRPGQALRVRYARSSFRLVLLAGLLGTSHTALAQAPAAAAAEEPETIIITGEKKDTYDVLPDRATASVFGTTRSLAETPRSVTLIEASLIDLYGIRTVNDFVNITAGTFTGNYFGVAGALDVRGERADNFFRGFRRIENRGNFPTAVTASDFVEVIKGPPPVIYGGGKVGGILNFVPKSGKTKSGQLLPHLTGEVSLIGGTYGKKVANVEIGGPFSIGGLESSIYVSGQIEDSKHYYHNIYNKNRLIQAALNTLISDKVRLEYGGMYQNADLNQSLGWNRVTQQLIDSDGGMYLAGRSGLNLNTNGDQWLSPSEVNAYSLEQFAFANPFPYGALSANQKAAFALDPTTIKFVAIDHRTVQAEAIDFSKSKVWTSYFDVIWQPTDNLTIKNQSFFDYMDHIKYSSYGFTAKYKVHVFENKTTASFKVEPSDDVKIETVAGVSWRISDGREQESRGRGYQVLDRRDISFGATPNDRFEGAYTGTGNVPYNWDQQGRHTDVGLFGLIDSRFGDHVSLILGGRMDRYHVYVRGTDLNAAYSSASAGQTAWSYNASLTYTPVKDINLYVTHAKSSYVELGQGGVVDVLNVGGGTWVQDSDMTEVGLKGYVDHGSLYFNILGYKQKKSAFNAQANQFDYYKSKGIEIEARYALTRRLSLTASGTVQNTQLLNAPFFLGIPPGALGLDPKLTYGGRFTGVGALIGFNGPTDAPTPEQVWSLDGTYTHPNGWGFSLGTTHVTSMFAGYAKAVKLPAYTTVRAAAFFRYKKFEARVNVNNLTNTKYYTPQFLFWDVFVSPSVGRTAELTLTAKW
jgi:iron complex outermembrane receptor protein